MWGSGTKGVWKIKEVLWKGTSQGDLTMNF